MEVIELAPAAEVDELPLASETSGDDGQTLRDSVARSKTNDQDARNFPERIDRFELREKLGQGGMGQVFKAYDPKLEREVALKLPALGANDEKNARRLKAEAKAVAGLSHPNIVPIYETGEAEGKFYIVAQLVCGQNLQDRLATEPPDFRQAAEWTRQLAEALAYAHGRGVVHRDIKPANIMIDERCEALLMDFGLAKRLNEDAGVTREGTVLGTAYYMSPEQARGEVANVLAASDQYSLGVVLYEMLTGQKPFEGPYHSVLMQVVTAEPIAVRQHRPEVPLDLAEICRRAMSKSPADRFDSAGAMSSELDHWLNSPATPPPPPLALQSTRAKVSSRAIWPNVAAAIAAVVACCLLMIWYAGGSPGRPAPIPLPPKFVDPRQVEAATDTIPHETAQKTSAENVGPPASDVAGTNIEVSPAKPALTPEPPPLPQQPPAIDAEQLNVFAGRLKQSRMTLQKINLGGNPEMAPYCESAIRELDASLAELSRGIYPAARLKSAATDLELLAQMDLPVGNRTLLEQAQEHLRAALDGERLLDERLLEERLPPDEKK